MTVDLKKVPSTPGIYKFFNKTEIIYIGKAKNLKKRVSSYFGNSFKDRKTSQIKSLTDSIETFTTKNEVEALLLEQTLIKENKPKFNILLRDDKTYPYIYFSFSIKVCKNIPRSDHWGGPSCRSTKQKKAHGAPKNLKFCITCANRASLSSLPIPNSSYICSPSSYLDVL